MTRYLVVAIVAFVAGGMTVDALTKHETKPVAERAEVRTSPSDLQAANTTKAKPSLPAPTLPEGAKVLSTTEVVVQPEPIKPGDSAQPCKPLHLRLDTADIDGQPVVAIRSPDGEVLSATQFSPRPIVGPQKYRVGAFVGPGATVITATRIVGRFSFGGAAMVVDGHPGAAIGVEISL